MISTIIRFFGGADPVNPPARPRDPKVGFVDLSDSMDDFSFIGRHVPEKRRLHDGQDQTIEEKVKEVFVEHRNTDWMEVRTVSNPGETGKKRLQCRDVIASEVRKEQWVHLTVRSCVATNETRSWIHIFYDGFIEKLRGV